MTIDPVYLAVGGLTAAVAAGWQHLRTIFGYISSFVLVRATIHDPIALPVWSHLRRKWSLLPSGLLTYVGMYMPLKSRTVSATVPFRVPAAQNTIWRMGWRFIAASYDGERITITTLRGIVNLDALVSAACHGWVDVSEESEAGVSRFLVNRVKGREKYGSATHGGHDRVSEGGSGFPPVSSSQRIPGVDLTIDRSMAWPHEEYAASDRSEKPFQSLWFGPEITQHIEQAQQWRGMGEWFRERNLPWRRGWLLYGPGGTGKSSLAKALAQKLNVPLYQFFLATLSDQEFLDEWDNMRLPCVALFEDFDTVFCGREPLTEHKSLTFDCVLNAISGVSSPRGVFLVVTTNKIDSIDRAMGVAMAKGGISTRPGRIDAVIELGEMSALNREHMAIHILRDWPDECARVVSEGAGMTPAQFQELCVRTAFETLAKAEHAAPRLRLVS